MSKLYSSSLTKQLHTATSLVGGRRNQQRSRFVDNRPSVSAQARMVASISCAQYKLPGSLIEKDQTAKVWLSKDNEKTDGILCEEIEEANKKSVKSDALKNIAEKAAAIGKGCGDHALRSDGKGWVNDNWETGANYNNTGAAPVKINPFQVPIACEYSTTAKARAEHEEAELSNTVRLIMRYHFGPYNNGYVLGVTKNNKRENSSRSEVTYSGFLSTAPSGEDEYSNTHASVAGTVLDATKGLKDGNRADKYDAYTKLVGEGARFQCVRNNISIVKDDTCFYTTVNPQSTDKVGILYKDLCKCWGDVFGEAFDIDNQRLIAALRDGYSKKEVRIKNTRRKDNVAVDAATDKIELV